MSAPSANSGSDPLAKFGDPQHETSSAEDDTQTAAPGKSGRSPNIIVRRISDIEAKPIRWLWPHRIARGKVSIIAGHPGLGKSQLTAAIAAVVTTGSKWPVDGTPCERGSVILLNAEDDASDTIRPRLEAVGADTSRIEIIEAVSLGFSTSGLQETRTFNLKKDLGSLDATLRERSDVALAVIDPMSAYLSGIDTHVDADVRGILAPMAELAARHSVAIVCVKHLNKGSAKSGNREALLRVTGSLGFVAAARAGYIIIRDPDHSDRRLFLPMKSNNGRDDMPGLAFTIESCFFPGDIETSRIVWAPEPVTITADEAIAATPTTDSSEPSELEATAEWLVDLLTDAGGELPKADVMKAAEAAGYKQRGVYRAREAAGVSFNQIGFGKGKRSIWRLDRDACVRPDPSVHATHDGGTNGTNGDRPGGSTEGASHE
jgi:hypothetical protein